MPRSAGDRLALARLLTAVENRTAGRRGRAARALPDGRTGASGRDHRAARVGQVDARRGAHRRGPRERGRTGGGHRGRSVEPDHRRRAARRPRPDAGLRGRRRRVHPLDGVARARRRAGLDRRRAAAAVLDAAGFDLDPHRDRRDRAERGRGGGRRRHDASCSRRPRWATRSRRSRPACSRSPTSSSSTRATSPGRSGPRPSCGRCSVAWRAHARGDGRPDRPRPKRPEVLITTAATGEGVPELLVGAGSAPCGRAGGASAAARLARAEAQVWAIVADRLRAQLRSMPGTRPRRRPCWPRSRSIASIPTRRPTGCSRTLGPRDG